VRRGSWAWTEEQAGSRTKGRVILIEERGMTGEVDKYKNGGDEDEKEKRLIEISF
jgi:hypothetical protein